MLDERRVTLQRASAPPPQPPTVTTPRTATTTSRTAVPMDRTEEESASQPVRG